MCTSISDKYQLAIVDSHKPKTNKSGPKMVRVIQKPPVCIERNMANFSYGSWISLMDLPYLVFAAVRFVWVVDLILVCVVDLILVWAEDLSLVWVEDLSLVRVEDLNLVWVEDLSLVWVEDLSLVWVEDLSLVWAED